LKNNNFLIVKSKTIHPLNENIVKNYYILNNFYYSVLKSTVIYKNLFNILNIIYENLIIGFNIYFYSAQVLKPYLNILNTNIFTYYFLQNNYIFMDFNSSWLRNKRFKHFFRLFLKKQNFNLIFLYDLNYYKLNNFFFKSLNKPIIGFQSLQTANNVYTYSIICNTSNILNYYLIYLTINKIYMLNLINRQKIFFFHFFKNYLKFFKNIN